MTDRSAVGFVVGEVRTDAFTFVTNPDLAPPRLEYVCVRGVRERAEDETRLVDVLAQVVELSVNSRLLAPSMNYAEVESILRRLGSSPPVVVGQAKVLGYLDAGGAVRLPRGAAMPGAEVEQAPDELLRRFFSRDVASGLEIGTLINRPHVDVLLDPQGLRRHLAVIAQTGAGKSYAVGVLLESLLQLGGTVVVFDPNSDYVLMGQGPDRRPTPFAERVAVYRLESEHQRRYTDDDIGRVERLTVQFSRLDVDEICDLAGIRKDASNIRKAVRTGCERLERAGRDYTPEMLCDELESIASEGGLGPPPRQLPPDGFGLRGLGLDPGDLGDVGDLGGLGPDDDERDAWFGTPEERARREAEERAGAENGRAGGGNGRAHRAATPDEVSGAGKALKYIEFLKRLKVWGFEDLPLDALLRPMYLAAVDLAGVDRKVADFVVSKIVAELWKRATSKGLSRPVFLVLEEAHNFVPGGNEESQAAYWLKRIASEGRKFGMFLVLVTQRPYRVHQDTLSQCGSQIIMRLTNPEDQRAVRNASESISESLLTDLPGLNIGEAVVLGPLVKVPVMIRVGTRVSREGGSDVDIVRSLDAARSEAVTEGYVNRHDAERRARGRTEWAEEL